MFHTGEGGAIFCTDEELRHKIFYSHNFGHNGPNDFFGVGINGKISELQAAMGLAVLPYMDSILEKRKEIIEFYNANLDFSKIRPIKIRENTLWNYSYFPVLIENESLLLELMSKLKEIDIYPRRYFNPSLNKLNYVKYFDNIVSERITEIIVCLPLYFDLEKTVILKTISIINYEKHI